MSAGGHLYILQENPLFWVPTIKVRPPDGSLGTHSFTFFCFIHPLRLRIFEFQDPSPQPERGRGRRASPVERLDDWHAGDCRGSQGRFFRRRTGRCWARLPRRGVLGEAPSSGGERGQRVEPQFQDKEEPVGGTSIGRRWSESRFWGGSWWRGFSGRGEHELTNVSYFIEAPFRFFFFPHVATVVVP